MSTVSKGEIAGERVWANLNLRVSMAQVNILIVGGEVGILLDVGRKTILAAGSDYSPVIRGRQAYRISHYTLAYKPKVGGMMEDLLHVTSDWSKARPRHRHSGARITVQFHYPAVEHSTGTYAPFVRKIPHR